MRGEEKSTSQYKSFKRFFKKRWVYPTVYIASAAIILTGVLWYQNSGVNSDQGQLEYKATDLPGKKFNDQPAVEVNRAMENFVMPVKNEEDSEIQMGFYDNESNKEEQEAALVFYNNTYHPNTGIDVVSKDGKEFDVVASLSGTVTKVMDDSLLGNVIVIEHDKGIETQYQSVKDYQVKVGDQVEQGQVIAKSSQSQLNEKAGNHVHFEIRKENVPVNPLDYFNKSLSSLQEAQLVNEKASAEDDAGKQEEGTPADDTKQPADDTKQPADDNKQPAADDKDSTKEGSGDDGDTSTDSDASSNS